MLNTKFKIEGREGDSYLVFEYSGAGAIFVYRGYINGNTIKLYPKHSLCRGVTRSKKTLSIMELARKAD